MTVTDFVPGDKDALYSFLEQIWPDRTVEQLDRRWWWWAAPYPPLVLARGEAGEVIGTCGHLGFDLDGPEGSRRGGWVIDYFVHPDHQGKGIGKRMLAEVATRYEFLASLNQTDAAWATFKRAGWRPRTFIPLYLSPSSRLSELISGMRAGREFDTRIGDASFGEDFDALWERSRTRVTASVRDAGMLNRRFVGGHRHYVVVRADRAGQLAGYMVLRKMAPGSIRSFGERSATLVADYLVDPSQPGAFLPLLRAAAGWCAGEGVRFLLCMASDPLIQRTLARTAFLSPGTPAIGGRLRKLAVGQTATASGPDSASWHLTPMDCDLDLLFDK